MASPPTTSFLYAFAPSTPFPFTRGHLTRAATPLSMMAKRGGAASEKRRAAKNKRASSPGTGFNAAKKGSKVPPVPVSTSESESDAVDDADADGDVLLEKPSGAAGDATPHRAVVKTPASAVMEDPRDDALSSAESRLVELPAVTAERKKELRLDRHLTADELVESFADARKGEHFAEVVVANRDLVTERMLYRFTSAILQVETRKTDVESRAEEAKNMRALRQDLIAVCWSYDYPLKWEVQLAEGRLLSVLQGADIKRDVAKNCGRNTLEVNCFWIVIFAAISAWEERGKENPELVNVDMQKVLAQAAEACAEVPESASRLSPALKALQSILRSSDPKEQAAVVESLDESTIEELGCFTEQVRLLPTGAYGGLVRRMDSILAYIWADKFGVRDLSLRPLRFELPETERASRLVAFSKTSNEVGGSG